ncbi:MAG: GNAT family N-acetyltransferase, partial [Candidatus Helarchaeota archaeon]
MEKVLQVSKNFIRTIKLKNGVQAILRPINPNDENLLLDFFYSCSKETIFYRFMSSAYYNNIRKNDKQFVMNLIRKYIDIDLKDHMSIVAVIKENNKERIVSEGRYFKTSEKRAEVAIMTVDDWQRLGIATRIADFLKDIAITRNIEVFEGDILISNQKMLKIFRNLKIKYTRVLDY